MFEFLFTIFILYLFYRFCKWIYNIVTAESPAPSPYTDEEKAQAQKDWIENFKFYKSFENATAPGSEHIKCMKYMIENGELKHEDGTRVRAEFINQLIDFRNVTEKCFELDLDPKKKRNRDKAAKILEEERLENEEVEFEFQDDDDDDYSYYYSDDSDDDYSSSSSYEEPERKTRENKEYGTYVIQYRSGSSWIDGPGSNDERAAESMFDSFIARDPRGSKRCRLVYKVNGSVKNVLSTN